MKILLISGSLHPESRSRAMVRSAEQALINLGVDARFLDLRDYPLPLCDGTKAYEDPKVDELSAIIAQADAILVGVPIYNFYVNAAVKNLVELTGSAWEDQVVGFLCAAGGRSSYMAVMDFANGLMLDFRCLIIPRFIYAVKSDFRKVGDAMEVANPEIVERIQRLAVDVKNLAPCKPVS